MQGQLLGPRLVGLGPADRAGLDHGLEHEVGPLLGAAEIAGRGELRGRAHEAGQHRRLRQGQLLGAMPEIAPRRRIRPVGAGAKIGGVEVADEDLGLRQRALQAQRQKGLLDLAPERLLLGERGEPGILLGDGRAALAHAAAGRVAPHRAGHAAQVDAPVAVEAPVLDRHDGLGEPGRQRLLGQPLALERAAGGERATVFGLDHEGALGGLRRHAAERRQSGEGGEDISGQDHQRQADEDRPSDEPGPTAGSAGGATVEGRAPCLRLLDRRRIRHGCGGRRAPSGRAEAVRRPRKDRRGPLRRFPGRRRAAAPCAAPRAAGQPAELAREQGGRPRGLARRRARLGPVRARPVRSLRRHREPFAAWRESHIMGRTLAERGAARLRARRGRTANEAAG